MKRILFSLALLGLAGVEPAFATGGFACEADDKNLIFSAQSPLGRGMGSPIINLQATSEIKLAGTPADLAKLDLSKHLVHSWMAGPDLRLHFYREREGNEPHAYVELIIMTKVVGDEGATEGTFQLTVFSSQDSTTLEASGKVTCSVE
jgi:hypothetical protein